MKIVKQTIAVVLICITCISLVGCFLPKNEELYSSSTEFWGRGDVQDVTIVLKATSKNTVVPIDEDIDIILIYYHQNNRLSTPLVKNFSASMDMIVRSFEDKEGKNSSLVMQTKLKDMADFKDEKYALQNAKEVDYAYCKDVLKIDNDWLVSEAGYITIQIVAQGKYVDDKYETESEFYHSAITAIYYFKTKNNILLFGHERDYNKYIKNNIFI